MIKISGEMMMEAAEKACTRGVLTEEYGIIGAGRLDFSRC
ncbi:hypothetical protein SD77_3577 [Bacillus badius]|uniref:Uncharacterized protein n=1 Tax=Bacillus badius TaxID=1455 RepID=A0ABR5AWM5_BACBA|nr:hypothetical protein SD78_1347 [Bacillus badius]KIL79157.1 hypothetical protein SD77_3577 [Bacillus badius]